MIKAYAVYNITKDKVLPPIYLTRERAEEMKTLRQLSVPYLSDDIVVKEQKDKIDN